MLDHSIPKQTFIFKAFARRAAGSARWRRRGLLIAGSLLLFSSALCAQQPDANQSPVVVQPGAPGQPTRVLPSSTRPTLTLRSPKNVEFMQGMIHHHSQAVEMTALIESRTENKNIRLLGARISQSQTDEMNFMKQWLEVRSEPLMAGMSNMDMSGMSMSGHHRHMPGMLSAEQMDALKKARGAEFDRLFLKGMIQHHTGALAMVKDLFNTAGAGQEPELFNFATDVDSGQRAEIKIMQTLLGEKP